ncbi:TerB family tellurite resistance protein [bacterium]|nr:TerB family tellurite resistance protein [bacterium]
MLERKNKDIAGYLILNILAKIDGDFDAREGNIIVEYVQEAFPLGSNLDNALEELSKTKEEDYPLLFQKCAEDFYADSTEKERLHFIDFTLKLINADHKIDQNENWMLNKLYQYWDL